MRIGFAIKCFFKILANGDFAADVERVLRPAPPPDPEVERRRAMRDQLQLVALLQRDGRLLDFLSEDLSDYSDEQIGAAVRDIHRDCRATLAKYLELRPVVDQEEESLVEVPRGFDPEKIQLTGNVAGEPPFRGKLSHRGWIAAAVRLPDRPEGGDPALVAPAVVEIA
jgi:hypothetical protein